MTPLGTNYSVKDEHGHTVRAGLTLAQAVEVASRDRYKYTIHWAGAV